MSLILSPYFSFAEFFLSVEKHKTIGNDSFAGTIILSRDVFCTHVGNSNACP